MSDYDLKKSVNSLGKLSPVLVDAFGNIIDGVHRKELDPDWPVQTVDSVDNPIKLELARLATNACRRIVADDEFRARITFLVSAGLKAEEIAEKTGLSVSTVYKYTPQELKDEKKVEAGKVSGVVRSAPPSEQTVKTQDMATFGNCEHCGVATSSLVPVTINGKPRQLCERCETDFPLRSERYHAFFRNVNGEKQVPKPEAKGPHLESWQHRESQMHPQHGKAEEKIIAKLRGKGYNVETDVPICLVSTVPDFNIVLSNDKVVHGYIDGPVHGNRRDKDENLRDLLRKREPSARIVSVDVKGDSDREVDEKVAEIEEALKWEA